MLVLLSIESNFDVYYTYICGKKINLRVLSLRTCIQIVEHGEFSP
jgi:hypothetical protein